MPAMEIDRRGILRAFGIGLTTLAAPALARAEARELFLAARRESDGNYAAVIFDASGVDVARVPLPGRGHDSTVRPGTRECVTFARRPGNFAVAFTPDEGRPPVWFSSREGRHFYGHGVFSLDGRLLYTTENDYESGEGIIGVRDATGGYRQIGEFASYGTGPHDIALLPDGRTLVVANGGIRTHPDYRRQKLNLTEMKPSLAYIDLASGDLVDQVALPAELHQLSIRHLAVAGRDRVVFGGQHQGPREERPALLGMHRPGTDINLFQLGEDTYARMANYVSSVEADSMGDYVAATSSHGGIAVIIDLTRGNCAAVREIRDVSGVARRRGRAGFLSTTGGGDILLLGGEDAADIVRPVAHDGVAWDNHAINLGG